MSRTQQTIFYFVLSLAASCDSGPALRLLDGQGAAGASGNPAPPAETADAPSTLDDEARRLHDMQQIRLFQDGTVVELSVEETATIVFVAHCYEKLLPASPVPGSQCDQIFRTATSALCTAGFLLELAGSTHAPIAIESEDLGTWTITPQPAGPRHRAAQMAAVYANWAGVAASAALTNQLPSDWVSVSGQIQPEDWSWPAPVPDTSFSTSQHVCGEADLLEEVELVEGAPATIKSRAAATVVESYHLLKEAAMLAGEIGLGVADAQVSDTSSPEEGRRRQMTATELSRSALAHMLVGGAPGLHGNVEPDDLCTSGELSDSVRRAISLFREAGISPVDILATTDEDPISTEDLLNDNARLPGGMSTAAKTDCGSLRERLYQQWGHDPALADLGTPLPELLHLSIGDFRAAREYLAQEIKTFSRSHTAKITAGSCETATADYPKFAATSSEPHSIDPVYWATLARYSPTAHLPAYDGGQGIFVSPGVQEDQGPQLISAMPGARGGLASMLNISLGSAARALRSRIDLGTPSDDEAAGLLHILLADAQAEQNGRLHVMRWVDVTALDPSEPVPAEHHYDHLTWVTLTGASANEGLIVVRGEDGLRCALYGHIEGAPCNTTDLEDNYQLAEFNLDYLDALTGAFVRLSLPQEDAENFAQNFISNGLSEATPFVPEGRAVMAVMDTSLVAAPERFYVVKPRPNLSAEAGSGDYIAVTGFHHLESGHHLSASTNIDVVSGDRDMDVFAVVPELDRRAAEYLKPNSAWCSKPQLTCAGGTFDERLALESELTEDGSEFEDSWRHYLTLARQAADEADALGQRYLEAEFSNLNEEREEVRLEGQTRERRERELEELQNICGTAMETDKLFKLLVPMGDLAAAAPSEICTSDADCGGPLFLPSQCFAGHCIQNMQFLIAQGQTDPDISRLHQCLTAADSGRLATAGDAPLCVTLGGGNRNRICETSGGDCGELGCAPSLRLPRELCPIRPTDGASCDTMFPEGENDFSSADGDVTASVIPLNHFHYPDTPGPVSPLDVCEAFRIARGNADNVLGNLPDAAIATEQIRKLRNDDFFFDAVQDEARHIGFRPFGLFGEMTYRDAQAYAPSNGGWPCVNASDPTDKQFFPSVQHTCETEPLASGAFFCQSIDCTNDEARATWASRALWATVALHAMAYRGAEWQYVNGEFPRVDPLQGVGLLEHGGSLVESSQYESSRTLPWYNGYGLMEVIYSSEGHWSADYAINSGAGIAPENDPARRFFGYINPLPAVPYLQWVEVPDSRDSLRNPLRYHEGGTFQPLLKTINLAGLPWSYSLSPAPFWWIGLSRLDTEYALAPHIKGDNVCGAAVSEGDRSYCETAALADYPNARWILNYLDHGKYAFSTHAPTPFLWGGGLSGIHQTAFSFPETGPLADRAVLDAVELLCHFKGEYGQPSAVLLDHPPDLSSIDDLDDAAEWFKKVGATLNGEGSMLVFAGLPDQAIDALSLNPVNSVYPALGGELSVAIHALRESLIQISEISPKIASEIALLGEDIGALHSRVRVLNLQQEQVNLRQLSSSLDRLADCAAQTSALGGVSIVTEPGRAGSAAITCANAAAQIVIGAEVADLENEVNAELARDAMRDFDTAMITRRDMMRDLATALSTANEAVNRELATIDNLKNSAKRALQRALFMQTDLAEKQAEVSGAMRARAKVDRERYERALANAKRMAFLAKRSIEQRLGVYLSEMTDDLPLVDAPATWEARVCSTTGVDFESFQALADEHAGSENLSRFSDSYVGDYVGKLENLIESYPLEHNFHQSEDSAVVSLRDDLFDLKTMCEVPTGNLLYHSGDLDRINGMTDSEIDPGLGSWVLDGCDRDAEGVPLRDCIAVSEVAGDSPLPVAAGAAGHEVLFGDDGTACDPGDPDPCGFTGESVLKQDVLLGGGLHLLSWYAEDASASAPAVYARDEDGVVLTPSTAVEIGEPTNGWRRYSATFLAPESSAVSIVIGQPSGLPASVTVAAIMLEDISRLVGLESVDPRPYAATDFELTRPLPVCADRFGDEFSRAWRYQCANLCPGGFGTSCGADAASRRCYYELSFGLSQSGIEEGKQLRYAGFAFGNFNYRFDTVAVNFVGTGTRDCDGVSSDSCFSAGFIPYSLQHSGPFTVRNHMGGSFDAKLFTGNIEHARGLAAERVVTNPISSADRDLLQDYQKGELRGRPLDGSFTLRVWDEPGVNWSAIEDVQLVIGYRYWTRFN